MGNVHLHNTGLLSCLLLKLFYDKINIVFILSFITLTLFSFLAYHLCSFICSLDDVIGLGVFYRLRATSLLGALGGVRVMRRLVLFDTWLFWPFEE